LREYLVKPQSQLSGIGIGWLATLMLLAALAATSGLRCSAQRRRPPDIILISIDTLRGDYFTPERMPLLYEFAKDNCAIYTNAHSNSTWTKPSHVTMLTGLLQSEHGVEYDDSAIPAGLTMIQEKLQRAGYTTAAFVGGGYVSDEWGFDRGFDTYWQRPSPAEDPSLKHMTFSEVFENHLAMFDQMEQYLSSRPRQPLFLFAHTYAVHDYWYEYYPGDRKIQEYVEELKKKEDLTKYTRPELGVFLRDTSAEEMRELYEAVVFKFDKRLHQFLSLIKQSPNFSNTMIIITSDHGEGLGDIHADRISYMHAGAPYADQIRVPMIVFGLDVGENDQLVGVDDIAGTILRLAGIEKDPPKSLFRKRDVLVSEYISHVRENPHRAVAIVSDDEKYLLSQDGDLRRYQDPGDSIDLIGSPFSPFIGWAAAEGLYGEEGPYPQWDTPVVRWAYGPRTTLKFMGDGRPARLGISFRRNDRVDQVMRISLNGEQIETFEFVPDFRFHHRLIPLQTREGENTLVFEYRHQQDDRRLAVCFERIIIVSEGDEQFIPKALLDWHAMEFSFTGWEKASGLGPAEGPYPDWDLRIVRWGLWPQTQLEFDADGKPLALEIACGTHYLPWQEITILLNGEEVGRYRLGKPGEFMDIRLAVAPRIGRNSLVIEYDVRDQTDPKRPLALLFKRLRIVSPELSARWNEIDENT